MANPESAIITHRLSPCENSPSPEQGSPRNNNEQSLHILVEPQPDGHMNVIHLVNPINGQVFTSLVAGNGTCIEIQPGVLFRVPFPEEHGYRTFPPNQFPQAPYPTTNIVPPNMQIPGGGMFMPRANTDFYNPPCPIHGPQQQQNPNGFITPGPDDLRLERRREKLQRKLRDKQSGPVPNCNCQVHCQAPVARTPHKFQTRQGKMNGPFEPATQENGDVILVSEVDGREADEAIPVLAAPEATVNDASSIHVSWAASVVNNISGSNHTFELDMSSKGVGFKTIYCGKEVEYLVNGLNPATAYNFRLRVTAEGKRGKYSETTTVKTACTIPSVPSLPKVTQKTKTTLLLRWSAPDDGGSVITAYSLEWDNGKPKSDFEEVYNGSQRQYKLSHKLPPSTPCKFRLRASNTVGWSGFSQVLECMTSACPPETPDQPKLVKATSVSITLRWTEPKNNGAPITEYRLEMDDEKTGYGFKPVYCGENREFTCKGLHRDTTYKFRLLASNVSGSSKYCNATSYKTLPEAPSKIEKPRLVGKAKTHSFTLAWDPPKDTGGPEIDDYVLEICDIKAGDFLEAYRGIKTECVLNGLTPGHTYKIRVSGLGVGGKSTPSTVAHITTLPVCPCKPNPPRLSTKHKQEPNTIHLEWDCPKDDGGSAILNYLVKMRGLAEQDDDFKDIYEGSRRQSIVSGLAAGEMYCFKLQATNKAGASPWSDASELQTAPGPPDAPSDLLSVCKSPTHIRLDWSEPETHGSPVTGYIVEQLHDDVFTKVYEGESTYCEVKKRLSPATFYYFRVQALSGAGSSPFSVVCSIETPPAPPAVVSVVKILNQTSSSVLLQWKHPVSHGAAIQHYVIEVSGATTTTVNVPVSLLNDSNNDVDEMSLSYDDDDDGSSSLFSGSYDEDRPRSAYQNREFMDYDVTGLLADTAYRIRVQAVNRIGSGPFSHGVQCVTKELPPSPPNLEMTSSSYHSLKLKWGESISPRRTNLGLHFTLQMKNKSNSFKNVFTGMGQSFSVSKLKELTPYTFRINAKNDAGDGIFSEPKTFYTKAQPPHTVKDLSWKKVSSSSASLSWNPVDSVKEDDEITYIVQKMLAEQSKDFTEVYHGNDTKTTLNDLLPEQEYHIRVCASRKLSESSRNNALNAPSDIKGSFSSTLRMRVNPDASSDVATQSTNERLEVADVKVREISDTQVTLLFFGLFLCIGLVTALALWFFMGEIKF